MGKGDGERPTKRKFSTKKRKAYTVWKQIQIKATTKGQDSSKIDDKGEPNIISRTTIASKGEAITTLRLFEAKNNNSDNKSECKG